MVIKATQKVIKIGSSAGVTIPAKELKRGGVEVGDMIEFSFSKSKTANRAKDTDVIEIAKKILREYKQDFDNLAQR